MQLFLKLINLHKSSALVGGCNCIHKILLTGGGENKVTVYVYGGTGVGIRESGQTSAFV